MSFVCLLSRIDALDIFELEFLLSVNGLMSVVLVTFLPQSTVFEAS
jgi:hypothetical protein